jgi:hypothetical protein
VTAVAERFGGLHDEEVPRTQAPPGRPQTDIAKRFAGDTAGHRMVVLHDDGLYRHIRFQHHVLSNDAEYRRGHSIYWFDIIAWPGNLTINGDCGTFTFARELDMFEFFRGGSRWGINPQYWAEKLRAPNPEGAKRYSEDEFRKQVAEEVAEAEASYPGLADAIENQFYGVYAEWNTEYEDGATRALEDFKFVPEGALCKECSEDGEPVVLVRERPYSDTLTCPHKWCGTKLEPFRFTDTWEWDLTDWDWQYLWCCHAIQYGIAMYDAQRVPA